MLKARKGDAFGFGYTGTLIEQCHTEADLPAFIRDALLAIDEQLRDEPELVLDEENRLETLLVTVMRRQGDDILVRGDALPGARVVVERTPLLGEGIKVRPLNPGAEAEAEDPGTLELTAARRERLMEFVQASGDMSAAVKRRLLGQLEQTRVPARVVERLERRMGG